MGKSSYTLFNNLGESYKKGNRFPPVIIADNLRTPENMGMILRLAGNINSPLVIFIVDDNVEFRVSKIKRASSGASEKVDWIIIPYTELNQHLPNDYQIVALETCDDSENIFSFQFPEKFALLVGNEVKGISDKILNLANHKIYIPVPGEISSMNVTHATSVALFQWYNSITL